MITPHRYAVLGNPVEHSRSPWIHARFAAQTGQALEYGRQVVPLDGFAAHLGTVRQHTPDAPGLHGCNVTVPFKGEAWDWVVQQGGHLSTRAALAEAVNTLKFGRDEQGQPTVEGDNTDGAGLVRDLTVNAGWALGGKHILLLGAGGAAAGVLGPLMQLRPATIVLANRTVGRSQTLYERHRGMCARHGTRLVPVRLAVATLMSLVTDHGGFDVVVNATSASLAGAMLDLPPRSLKPGGLGVDLMYGPAARPFLQWVHAHGGQGRDGLGMLVEQAAESFALWRGVRPDTAPVLAELRALVDAAA